MKFRKGFTLVELLVVIAILAILSTATIVGFTAFTQKAELSNLEGELKQVTELLQLEDYYNDKFEIIGGEGGMIKNTTSEPGAEYTQVDFETLILIIEDPEISGLAGRLTYSDGILTLLNEINGNLKAEWNVRTNTIKSGKTSRNLWG